MIMTKQTISYPALVSEYSLEGQTYLVTIPAFPGLMASGESQARAIFAAEEALSERLCGLSPALPPVKPIADWEVADNQSIQWLTVPVPAQDEFS